MANDIKFGIRVGYDGKEVTAGVTINRENFRQLAADAQAAGKSLTGAYSGAAEGVRSVSTQLSQARALVAGAFAADQVKGYLTYLLQASSAQTQFSARIRTTSEGMAEAARAEAGVLAYAQRWGVVLNDAGAGFARLNPAVRQLNGDGSATLQMMNALSASARLQGATTAENSAVMLQFAQALGSGVVAGDEFKSLMENAQPLMREVAAVLGKTTGELKLMASEGKLTSEVFGNAVLQASAKLVKMAEGIPPSFDAATQAVKNSAQVITAAFVDGFKGSSSGTGFLSDIAESLAGAKTEAGAAGAAVQAMVGPLMATAAYAVLKTASKLGPMIEDKARLVAAEVQHQVALRETALITKAAAAEEVSRLAAGRSALQNDRDRALSSLAAANSALQAAAAGSKDAAVLREAGSAAAAKRTALRTLADTAQSMLSVNDQLTAAERRYESASDAVSMAARAKSTAVNLAKGAIAALGGPVGLAITGITGLAAWFITSREEAAALETQLWKTKRARDAIAAGKAPTGGDMQAMQGELQRWQDQLDQLDQQGDKGSKRDQIAERVAALKDQMDYARQAARAEAEAQSQADRTIRLSDPGALAKLTADAKWATKLAADFEKAKADLATARDAALKAATTDARRNEVNDMYAGGLAKAQEDYRSGMEKLQAPARAIANAKADQKIADAKAEADRLVSAYQQEYETFRISTEDFIRKTTEAKDAALAAQIKVLEGRRSKAKPEESISIQTRINELGESREKLGRDAAELTRKAALSASDALANLTAASGRALDPLKQAEVDFEKKFGEILKRAAADGNESILQAGKDAWSAIVNQTNFSSAKERFDAALAEMQAQIETVRTAAERDGGVFSGLRSDQEVREIKEKAIPALNELIAKMREAAGQSPINLKAVSDAERSTQTAERDTKLSGATEGLSRSINDALMRGFEGGKGSMQNLRDTLKNQFRSLVLTPMIKPVTDASAKALGGLVDEAAKWASGLFGSTRSGLSSAISDGFSDSQKSATSFADQLTSMFKNLVLEPTISPQSSGGGGGGFFSSLFSSFSGSGSGASAGSSSIADSYWMPSADGNVFSGAPGLHRYVNTVQTSPQYFGFQTLHAFAAGGVFAEAGPEAVMPLARDAQGRLGVRSQGGSDAGGALSGVLVSLADTLRALPLESLASSIRGLADGLTMPQSVRSADSSPRQSQGAAAVQAGGVTVQFTQHVTIDARGADAGVDVRIMAAMERAKSAAVAEINASLARGGRTAKLAGVVK